MGDDAAMRSLALRSAAALAAAALCLGAAASDPLADLLRRSDGAVLGHVRQREVRAFPAPDGGELYFTVIRVEGTDLATGRVETIDVTFSGGFITETRGAHSSTAPPEDATRVGRRVLAFHRHVPDIAEGFAGEALVNGDGGLFGWFPSRKGETIVQGRGRGAAIERNVRLPELRARAERDRAEDGR